jgi:hypothetical protein
MNETLNFNFDQVEDFKGRIEPGVEECVITGITQNENANGKPYIEMGFVTLDKQREHKEKFYISSEKAQKMTLLRFKHIIKVLLGPEKAENKYSLEQLNKLFTGLKGRFLFVGEEYIYDGEIRIRTNLAFFNFVEPLTIPKEKSKLKYDPLNKNHMKKLPKDVYDNFMNSRNEEHTGVAVSEGLEETF